MGGARLDVTDTASTAKAPAAASGATVVLLTLAAGQFLMTLDSSVMNVSIATVAKDVGTTVTGIQGAITAYTLVMAALMITGAKIGAIIGRKRAFAIGCVIYGCGSFMTSIAQSLPVLLFGWSFLEGVGAALILPAIVALVAANFPAERRPAAYGLVAAAGAIAVAVGPLDRRLLHDVLLVALGLRRRGRGRARHPAPDPADRRRAGRAAPAPRRRRRRALRRSASACSCSASCASSEWGWIQPKPDGPSWAGLSPTVWLILVGLFVIWLFFRWEDARRGAGRRAAHPRGAAAQPAAERRPDDVLLPVPRPGGAVLRRAALPLGLPRALGARHRRAAAAALAHAADRGARDPAASSRTPRRGWSCARGLLALLAGTVVLLGALDADAGPEIVLVPMLLIGLGIGALASQLGAVTVSAVPDDQSPEVGGVQNTATNLGASIGTALAGSLMIARRRVVVPRRTSQQSPAIPSRVKAAGAGRARGRRALHLRRRPRGRRSTTPTSAVETTDAALDAYRDARLDGLRAALAILALLDLVALFLAQRIPRTPVGRVEP